MIKIGFLKTCHSLQEADNDLLKHLRVGAIGGSANVDNVWDQRKLETRELFDNSMVDSWQVSLFRIIFVPADFDDRLWFSLMDFATVYSAEDVRFTFKDNTELKG